MSLLRRSPEERAALVRAKATLDTFDFYPEPVKIDRVRILHVPWLFRLPWFRRFQGYTMWNLILLRMALFAWPIGQPYLRTGFPALMLRRIAPRS